jgi:hypothetical protein
MHALGMTALPRIGRPIVQHLQWQIRGVGPPVADAGMSATDANENSRLECAKSCQKFPNQRLDRLEAVARRYQHDDGHRKSLQILLEFDVLIGRQQGVEFCRCLPQESAMLRLVQPICVTVRTSCPVSRPANGLGKDSSSRSRTGGQKVLGDLQGGHRLLVRYGREVVEESLQAIASGEVVQEVFHRDARPDEHWGSSKNIGIAAHH